MAAALPGQGAVSSAEGVVTGAPRRWLRLEGLVLLAGALIAFGALGQPWSLVPTGILLPDIAMSGYVAGTRPGAHLYNLAHATLLPAVMLGAGYWQADRLLMALALIWLAHIGLDRLLGTGLKYSDRFTHTHLGDRRMRRDPRERPRRGGRERDNESPVRRREADPVASCEPD
jgi:hypothetical protein